MITAGGTQEKIDDVRAITNHATGTLGMLLAKEASKKYDVYLLLSRSAKVIDLPSRIHLIWIDDVTSLMNHMESLLKQHDFFAVIHTMAVSDYYLEGIANEEQIQQVMAEEDELRHYQWSQLFMPAKEHKLSSQHESIYLKLVPTPKVIQYIKSWSPKTILFGFKLLVNASNEELLLAAHKQQQLAHSDYVIINDQDKITKNQHHASLVQQNHILKTFHTKEEIVSGIMQQLLEEENK